MAVVAGTSIDSLYTTKGKLMNAARKVEQYTLSKNPAILAEVNTLLAEALTAIAVHGGGGTVAVITSATKITAPTSGSGTTGVTPTIVNGAVTALVVS